MNSRIIARTTVSGLIFFMGLLAGAILFGWRVAKKCACCTAWVIGRQCVVPVNLLPDSQQPFLCGDDFLWQRQISASGAESFWCEDIHGTKNGPYISFFPNKKRRQQYALLDNKRHGPAIGWYPNGRKEYEHTYLAGDYHGPATQYFENGGVRSKGEYSHGLRVGRWESLYENGNNASEATYKNGEPIGPLLEWYEDKSPKLEEHYDDEGRPDGKWARYHSNHRIASGAEFSHGVPIGTWQTWDEQGNETGKTVYPTTAQTPGDRPKTE